VLAHAVAPHEFPMRRWPADRAVGAGGVADAAILAHETGVAQSSTAGRSSTSRHSPTTRARSRSRSAEINSIGGVVRGIEALFQRQIASRGGLPASSRDGVRRSSSGSTSFLSDDDTRRNLKSPIERKRRGAAFAQVRRRLDNALSSAGSSPAPGGRVRSERDSTDAGLSPVRTPPLRRFAMR